MQRPKLAFVNQAWNPAVPPVTVGSIAIWVHEVARELAAEYDVSVYSRTVSGQPLERVADRVRYLRCSNWPTPFGGIGRLMLRGWSQADAVPDAARPGYFSAFHRRVARSIAKHGADLVHVQNLGQAACAVRRQCPQVRIVLHMHCEWLSQFPPALVEEWLDASDMIVGCSRYITRRIAAAWPAYEDRCATLYNAVDTSAFRPDGPVARTDGERDETILFVGRITPEKGLHVLLASFAVVLRARPRARLVIVGAESVTPREFLVDPSDDPRVRDLGRFYGNGPGYLAALQNMTDSDVRDRVHFVGGISHDALPDLYRSASILVNPSLSESFGMTVLEAMACGVPPVITQVGGMPEVVDDGRCGVIVEPGAIDQLAEAMIELLRDDVQRTKLGAQAARFAADNFSWGRIAQDALAIYRRCLEVR